MNLQTRGHGSVGPPLAPERDHHATRERLPLRSGACRTGVYGNLPVMDEVKREATRRGVELVILPTARAIKELNSARVPTHAILHVTC